MALKGVAVKAIVRAIDGTTGLAKTGDAANITITITDLDTGTVSTLTDTSATELSATNAPGYYMADVTAGEHNADRMIATGKSTTANVVCIGYALDSPADVIGWKNATAPAMTGDAYARLGAPAGASISADIAAVPTTAENADAVWDELISGHVGTPGMAGAYLAETATAANLATVDGILDGIVAGTTVVKSNVTQVNGVAASVQTDLAKTGDAMTLTSGERSSIATAVWAATTRTLSSFGTLAADVWAATTRVLTAATNITSNGSTIDQTKIANLDAAVSTRATEATVAIISGQVTSGFAPESTIEMTYQGINAIAGIIGNPSEYPSGSVCEDIAAVKSETAAIKLKTDTIAAAPTAAANATAVWAAGTRTLTAGTNLNIPAAAPTVFEIWAASSRTLTSDPGPSAADIWTYPTRTLTETSGSGSIPYVYGPVLDEHLNPLADVEVFVSTDESGLNLVAAGRTDNFGNVTLWLDAGEYRVWLVKAGIAFSNPDVITVVEP